MPRSMSVAIMPEAIVAGTLKRLSWPPTDGCPFLSPYLDAPLAAADYGSAGACVSG
jgi:hypothetical protein